MAKRTSPAAFAYHPGARAEAAIDGAAIGREEEDAIGIAADEIGGDFMLHLAERIVEIARRLDRFFFARDDLPPDGAFGIIPVHEAHIIGRDAHREAALEGADHPSALRVCEREMGLDSGKIANRPPRLTSPRLVRGDFPFVRGGAFAASFVR